ARPGVADVDERLGRRVEQLADGGLAPLFLRTPRRRHQARPPPSRAGKNSPKPRVRPSAGSNAPAANATRPPTTTARTAPSERLTMRSRPPKFSIGAS